jgi:MoaA/NifB/PqqE/SkfB family radical SAM enzyme
MKIVKIFKIFKKIQFIKVNPYKKKYPEILQLPITYKCNSRCRLCNIWKIDKEELSIEEFEKIIKDPIFNKIKTVGINGGEPTQLETLDKTVNIIIKNLPKVKNINIISNGLDTEVIKKIFPKIYKKCRQNNINFSISISLDGYNGVHNKARGLPNAFHRTFNTIKEIKNNLSKYADNYEVGCTISKINEDFLTELETFSEINNINIKYRMGEEIKRLGNKELYNSLNSFNGFSAREHIFKCVKKSKNIFIKFKYYSIFFSIINKKNKRLAGCWAQNNGITLDPNGDLYYCPPKSKNLGNLLEHSGQKIFFSRKNLQHRAEILKNKCDNCAHDYTGKIPWHNFIRFYFFLLNEKYWSKIYKIKSYF